MAKPKIPTWHGGNSGSPVPAADPAGAPSSTGGKGKSGSGSGSGQSAADKYYAQAKAEANQAKTKAQQRYIKEAQSLTGQIKALQYSLSEGFKASLEQRLQNIGLVLGQQDKQLMEGYDARVGSLKGAAKDNEAAAGDTSYQNLTNRGRERANAVSEAMLQGAGESDLLKSQMMSLRNWDANQGEINRSFFDTLRSVNSSLTDLNVDTKTARLNLENQANADRDQVWSQYYDQKSQTLSQLGNLYGQQASNYGLAYESKSGQGLKGKQNKAVKLSDKKFMQAAKNNAQVFENPGISPELQAWQGEGEIQGRMSNSVLANAPVNLAAKKPEGATLRKWAV